MSQEPSIDRLLNLVPDAPESVLTQLQQFPALAAKQDGHGYSLVHAAASYDQADLLKALIHDFSVDINIQDEDGETALFSVETVEMAGQLLELGINKESRNNDGLTAAEKLDDEDEQPAVAAFLKQGPDSQGQPSSSASQANGHSNDTDDLPPMPKGVEFSIGTMQPGDEGGAPDPQFRRMIEELAAREDFQSESGQRDLRDLVSQVVSGIHHNDDNPSTRRRVD